MSRDHLGLFDTPPDRRQVWFALALVGLLFVALATLASLRDILLPEIGPFIPMVDAIMLLGDLVTATLLYVQACVFRSRALTVLASGYIFNGLMLVAHMLTFPGAFAEYGLLGAGLNTTAWIANFWRAGIPVSIFLYVLLRRADAAGHSAPRPAPLIITGLVSATALAAAITVLATSGHDLLPSLFLDRYRIVPASVFKVNLGLITLLLVATVALFRNRRSILDLWLLVALAGWLAHALLNLQAWGRFTVGFYSQFGMLLFANLVVMLGLLAETSRLYTRLALSTVARDREREARWMSMEAVTTAISHEVGQPLSAVITNATGGLNWLKRERPDPAMAIKALHAIIDAGKRASDVTKSIRAMFARKPGTVTEFDLNELVCETTALLDRELAGERISLRLALDEALPPVLADRIQLQQVLINLLVNAIESLAATTHGPRRIAIHTAPLKDHDVLLEVSDTGAGIVPDRIDQIFEPFFTTKSTGTGVGLSLCRTIVEEHGGSLWASPGKDHGAIFHLRLPRGNPVALDA